MPPEPLGSFPEKQTVRTLFLTLLLSLLAGQAYATLSFEQPPDPAGGVLLSSWYFPDGSDYDMYVYDSFQLDVSQPITEVRWRGGYLYTGYGLVDNFSITFYESTANGTQPLCGLPGDGETYLANYEVGGTAGQTPAGTFGGIVMYDYHYELPQPFQAVSGVKYWIRIEGITAGLPFWGISIGTGGDNSHFSYSTGSSQFSHAPRDAAFSLHTTAGPTYTIATSADPAEGGTTTGDGPYPPGSTASVVATPNTGWGFVNWTENGTPVSNSATYTFTVTADRNLVAHFMTAYTVATSAQPPLGGATEGDGVYNSGSDVTVFATPNDSWEFVNWTEFGAPVSNSPSYSFVATSNRTLVANFALAPGAVLFDFDNAPLHTPLPIDLTVDGLSAHFSATGQSFSVQRADALGFTPAGFSGYCLYPSGVFAADLLVDFSAPLTTFSIMYCPQELGCDDSATMRVTAYLGGAYVGTETTTLATPGTWPTGILACGFPDGFDSVVVHYDSPPPTCQDWGPIFLADNMLVTVATSTSLDDANGSEHGGDEVMELTPIISPNPFGAEASVRFDLSQTGPVSVTVHDLQGRLVRTLALERPLSPGRQEISWDGRDEAGREVASGAYLCRVLTDGSEKSARMVLLRQR